MKYFKFNILLVFILSLLIFPSTAEAGTFSVYSNSYNVSVGSTITVSVTGTDLAGKFSITSSDSSIFSGGGNVWVDKDTQSVKFTAKSAGSVVITVKPVDVADYSGNKITTSKTIIVKSYVPRALSSDNYLSSLSIDGIELVPSFDKDTTSYIVDLEPGTTSITINAEKANKYASVSGAGIVEVKEGSNDIDIVVTAENGSKKTYRITAVVKEFNPIHVTLNGSDFTVVRKSTELIKPDFYEETLVQIGEDRVPGFYSEKMGYTLVGLKDVTGDVKLYIYKQSTNSYESYISLEFNKMNLIILEADENNIPKGFVKDTITINNENVTCYKNSKLGITLIYGKSIITGEANFYEYENTDFTIQKFNIGAYDKLNEKITIYSYVIISLGSLVLFILICLIISKITSKNKLKHKKNEIEKTMNIDIKKIQKEVKKDKNLEKLRKQQEKELKRADLEKKKKNKDSKEKDENMFYL